MLFALYCRQGLTYWCVNFSPKQSFFLQGWSDADWASDIDIRRSISSYLFQLETCLLSWHSCKQSIVALSSTKAKYISVATATKELIWLQSIIGYSLFLPTTIYCDNQSCIALNQNPKFHDRSKQIDLRYHFLHEKVNTRLLSFEYTSTSTMWTNIFTKTQAFCLS